MHDFAPYVLVRSDPGQQIPGELKGSVVCRVDVLYTDDMSVRIRVAGGRSHTLEDASMDELLSVVDEA